MTATKEAVWLRKLLSDLGFLPNGATVLHVDNQSTIRLIKNPEFHKRTKHIDIKFHYIREVVENGDITVQYVSTDLQSADMFTKAVPKNKLKFLCDTLGITDMTHSNAGVLGFEFIACLEGTGNCTAHARLSPPSLL